MAEEEDVQCILILRTSKYFSKITSILWIRFRRVFFNLYSIKRSFGSVNECFLCLHTSIYRAMAVSIILHGLTRGPSLSPIAATFLLDVFHMRCQWCLRCVFWQQHISNHNSESTKEPTESSLLGQCRLR